MNEVKRFAHRNAAAVVLVAGCVIFGIAAKGFLSLRSISSLLSQLSIQALLATGMLFAMLMGGMDLTVGATGALAGILAAYAQNWLDMRMGNVPAVLSVLTSIIVAVVTGIAIGSGIGTLIAKMNIPDVICTLVLMYGIRGLAHAVMSRLRTAVSACRRRLRRGAEEARPQQKAAGHQGRNTFPVHSKTSLPARKLFRSNISITETN